MIMVTPNLKPGAQGRSYQHLLTMSLADQIQAAAPAISAVSPVAQIEGRIIAGGFSAPSVITGITPAYTRIVNTRIALGRSLIQSEVDAAAHSIVLGSEAASDLFGSEDPIGRHVALVSGDHRAVFTVVGVTESKGALFWANSDTQAFIPVTTLLCRMSPSSAWAPISARPHLRRRRRWRWHRLSGSWRPLQERPTPSAWRLRQA